MRFESRFLFPGLAAAAGLAAPAAAQCPEWDPVFGVPGAASATILDPAVRAFIQHDHGAGPVLYAGGTFVGIGGTSAANVAMSADAGGRWEAMGSGVTGPSSPRIDAAAVFNDEVYFAGRFTEAGGIPTSAIARFDGTGWHRLGGDGLTHTTAHPILVRANALQVWDDGTGEALYVAGEFNRADGVPVNNIARWDGTAFSPLGQGLTQNGSPKALGVFQNQLYAGGNFFQAGGQNIRWFARWDGREWSEVPGFAFTGEVTTITTFDDGSGEALYFHASGWGVYKYDGAAFTDITANLSLGFFDGVMTLEVFDDGTGPALFAGGNLGAHDNLVKWDGSQWNTFAGGVDETLEPGATPFVGALAAIDDWLYVGGVFQKAGGAGGVDAGSMARWGCPDDPCYPDCNGDGVLDFFDFLCFQNSFLAQDPYADCNGDGVLDFFDFLCFQNEFLAGCP